MTTAIASSWCVCVCDVYAFYCRRPVVICMQVRAYLYIRVYAWVCASVYAYVWICSVQIRRIYGHGICGSRIEMYVYWCIQKRPRTFLCGPMNDSSTSYWWWILNFWRSKWTFAATSRFALSIKWQFTCNMCVYMCDQLIEWHIRRRREKRRREEKEKKTERTNLSQQWMGIGWSSSKLFHSHHIDL